MKRLYLMRHGETLFNRQHRLQGWCDSPLTSLGKRQALVAKTWFEAQGIRFDHAYSSTSERCCDTLELITSQPYQRLKGLKEMFYGSLEGHPEYLGSQDPKACETYYIPFGGESSNQVRDRMTSTLTRIMEQPNHHCVLAVSHGGACFNFLRGIQDPAQVLVDGVGNGSIFVYSYEKGAFTLKHLIRV